MRSQLLMIACFLVVACRQETGIDGYWLSDQQRNSKEALARPNLPPQYVARVESGELYGHLLYFFQDGMAASSYWGTCSPLSEIQLRPSVEGVSEVVFLGVGKSNELGIETGFFFDGRELWAQTSGLVNQPEYFKRISEKDALREAPCMQDLKNADTR